MVTRKESPFGRPPRDRALAVACWALSRDGWSNDQLGFCLGRAIDRSRLENQPSRFPSRTAQNWIRDGGRVVAELEHAPTEEVELLTAAAHQWVKRLRDIRWFVAALVPDSALPDGSIYTGNEVVGPLKHKCKAAPLTPCKDPRCGGVRKAGVSAKATVIPGTDNQR